MVNKQSGIWGSQAGEARRERNPGSSTRDLPWEPNIFREVLECHSLISKINYKEGQIKEGMKKKSNEVSKGEQKEQYPHFGGGLIGQGGGK